MLGALALGIRCKALRHFGVCKFMLGALALGVRHFGVCLDLRSGFGVGLNFDIGVGVDVDLVLDVDLDLDLVAKVTPWLVMKGSGLRLELGLRLRFTTLLK